MIARGRGKIVNIASGTVFKGHVGITHYVTSKGAIVALTRCLARELGPHNINVNAICPGFFMTKMAEGLIKSMGEKEMAAHAPLNRLGDDEDLKGLTLLYASEAGKHITGQWLAVDGGVSAIIGG